MCWIPLLRHVLSPGTFCHPARFVTRHVLSPGTFCHPARFVTRHVLSPGTFCHPARFVTRHVLSPGTFCGAWNHKMVPTQKPISAKGVTISFISFFIFLSHSIALFVATAHQVMSVTVTHGTPRLKVRNVYGILFESVFGLH